MTCVLNIENLTIGKQNLKTSREIIKNTLKTGLKKKNSIPHSKEQRFCDVIQILCIIESSFICLTKGYLSTCLAVYFFITQYPNKITL